MTFPCVRILVERGKLQLHGAYFGVATGVPGAHPEPASSRAKFERFRVFGRMRRSGAFSRHGPRAKPERQSTRFRKGGTCGSASLH